MPTQTITHQTAAPAAKPSGLANPDPETAPAAIGPIANPTDNADAATLASTARMAHDQARGARIAVRARALATTVPSEAAAPAAQ